MLLFVRITLFIACSLAALVAIAAINTASSILSEAQADNH